MEKEERIIKAVRFFERFGEAKWDSDLMKKKWFPSFLKIVKKYVGVDKFAGAEQTEIVKKEFEGQIKGGD
jgi:hypothetical protein